ncbi:hypothetical protein [Sorangium sp. So ce590]|uniref:hypothetical protein n=1 Tax=unclassified Sorangium TaxID=2621164 RepID=UPI003F60D538
MSGDDIQSNGKYFRVVVPNFGTDSLLGDTIASRQMSSYIRLGAVPTAPGSDPPQIVDEPGDDLAKLVHGFVDDTRPRDPSAHPVADRQAESAKLHTRGGWLDHSDGNRISTTRGDKIEVIRGNYKMVVLGRYPVTGDPTTVDGATGGTTSYESGGGHVQDWRVTPGAVTEITWVESRGTWKVHEKTEKGDVHAIYNGEVKEEFYGPLKESITGTESPGSLVPETNPNPLNDFTVTRENPVLIEKTWAQSIDSQTGSEQVPIPTITEKTWADSIDSQTGSTGKPVSTIHESTVAGAISSETIAGIINESTIGNTVSQQIGTSSSMLIGNDFSFLLGPSESIQIGAALDLFLGLKKLGIDISAIGITGMRIAPLILDLNVAKAINDIRIGYKFEVTMGDSDSAVIGQDMSASLVMKRLAMAIFLG